MLYDTAKIYWISLHSHDEFTAMEYQMVIRKQLVAFNCLSLLLYETSNSDNTRKIDKTTIIVDKRRSDIALVQKLNATERQFKLENMVWIWCWMLWISVYYETKNFVGIVERKKRRKSLQAKTQLNENINKNEDNKKEIMHTRERLFELRVFFYK